MFNSLRKFYVLRRAKPLLDSTSLTHELGPFRNPRSLQCAIVRYVSVCTNEDCFPVSYLVNKLGFSQTSALAASKYLRFDSPDKPDLVLARLESYGFSENQIRCMVKRSPYVLRLNPEILTPKLEFFMSKGMPRGELAHTLSAHPNIVRRSLRHQLIPAYDFIRSLVQSDKKTIEVIKAWPVLLCHDRETYMVPIVEVLQGYGVPVPKIFLFLRYWSHPGALDMDTFKEIAETVKRMGISPLKSQFVIAIFVLRGLGKSQWAKKIELYKKWGWSENEILAAFEKCPWFMIASENKITAAMEFFVNEMGWEVSLLAKAPILITLSLKKRLVPRCAVLQLLISKGLLKKKHSTLSTLLRYTEKLFLERCVKSHDEAPELLKLYRDRLRSAERH